MSALAQPSPPLSVRTHHKFKKCEGFFAKKYERPHLKNLPFPLVPKWPHWTTPLPNWGHLLWTAPKRKTVWNNSFDSSFLVLTFVLHGQYFYTLMVCVGGGELFTYSLYIRTKIFNWRCWINPNFFKKNKLGDLLHLLESTFDQKRIYTNPSSTSNPNSKHNPKVQ